MRRRCNRRRECPILPLRDLHGGSTEPVLPPLDIGRIGCWRLESSCHPPRRATTPQAIDEPHAAVPGPKPESGYRHSTLRGIRSSVLVVAMRPAPGGVPHRPSIHRLRRSDAPLTLRAYLTPPRIPPPKAGACTRYAEPGASSFSAGRGAIPPPPAPSNERLAGAGTRAVRLEESRN